MKTVCKIRKINDEDIVISKGYGGNAGRKLCYKIEGQDYMVKFPKSTRDLGAPNLRSYTTSPISEYIGSMIYASLGIPVHETILVECENKIAVACKDFTNGCSFIPFSDIKNTVDEANISGSYGSSSHGERLSDVLSVIENAPIFQDIKSEVKKRFWEMFVVDALILNNDRNNGNWGLLVKDNKIELAPVFDNGNAFFNKRNSELFEKRIESIDLIKNDIDVSCSFFTDNEDHHIHPFIFMETSSNSDLKDAINTVYNRLDMSAIESIIISIPEEFEGISVIDKKQKDYYTKILKAIYDGKLLPIISFCI